MCKIRDYTNKNAYSIIQNAFAKGTILKFSCVKNVFFLNDAFCFKTQDILGTELWSKAGHLKQASCTYIRGNKSVKLQYAVSVHRLAIIYILFV